MSLSFDTALPLLQNAKRVAIYPRGSDDTDSIASGIALAEVLTELGTSATVILDTPPLTSLSFLTGFSNVSTTTTPSQELLLEIPTTHTAIQSVSYERSPTKLTIHVSPRQGTLSPNSVRITSTAAQSGDVLVVIGARSLRELGPRFTQAAEQFYQKPTIAIDWHVDTTPFATVTLNDVGAHCASAITYKLITRLTDPLSPTVATALLAGVFAASQSFQRPMTSPAEFDLAATLLEHGANRHLVVKHLYKTKPLPTLKLWGRVLAKLKADPLERAWFAEINKQDLNQTKTNHHVLTEIVQDVVAQSSRALLIAVSCEINQTQTRVLVAAPRTPLLDQFIATLKTHTPVQVEHRNQVAQLSILLPLAETARLVRQTGEQIVQPGYTGTSDGKKEQQVDTASRPAVASAGRPRNSQPKTAPSAV